jgi:hypothetical protein
VGILAKWRAGSTKQRLLDQIDLQARLAAEDRRAFREMLLDQVQMTERLHAHTTGLVGALADSVTKQSESFNRYLDLVTPHGEPRVRVMNDAIEAKFEREAIAARPDAEEFEHLGIPIPSPLEEQLSHADRLADDLREMFQSIN